VSLFSYFLLFKYLIMHITASTVGAAAIIIKIIETNEATND
jgi:hypothetical protein